MLEITMIMIIIVIAIMWITMYFFANIGRSGSRLSKQERGKTWKHLRVIEGSEPTPPFQVPSLVDISSRLVALNFPFAYVEQESSGIPRNPPVPDELQLKIISFSFPDKEEIIEKWAKFSQGPVDISKPQQLCASGCTVRDLTQIGRLP